MGVGHGDLSFKQDSESLLSQLHFNRQEGSAAIRNSMYLVSLELSQGSQSFFLKRLYWGFGGRGTDR